jgi:hypothetical protein
VTLAPTATGLPLVTLTPAAVVTTTFANEVLTGSLNSRTTRLGMALNCAFGAGVILTSSAWADADVALITDANKARPRADAARKVKKTGARGLTKSDGGRRNNEWVNTVFIVSSLRSLGPIWPIPRQGMGLD